MTTYVTGDFTFDFTAKQIQLAVSRTAVTLQDLVNVIREAESSWVGIQYDEIAESSGKDDLGQSVEVGITVNLLNDWQLKFANQASATQCFVTDGNLVGGITDNPVAYSTNVQANVTRSAAATLVAGGGGSGLELTDTYEGTESIRDLFRLMRSALYGLVSGASTTTMRFRDRADTKDRIVATVDEDGNRSNIVTDPD